MWTVLVGWACVEVKALVKQLLVFSGVECSFAFRVPHAQVVWILEYDLKRLEMALGKAMVVRLRG